MEFIKPGINIDFIGKSKTAFCVSLTLILISAASLLIHKGPRYGIDFAGGTLIQVKFLDPVKIRDIKSGLARIELGKSSVQQFGDQKENEYLIRTDRSAVTSKKFSAEIQKARQENKADQNQI